MRSTNLVLFLVFLQLSAGFVSTVGIADDWGVDPETGADEKLDKLNDRARSIGANNSFGGTLFGLILTVFATFDFLISFVTVGPVMFANLGVPSVILVFVFGPVWVIIGFDFIEFLSGRQVT